MTQRDSINTISADSHANESLQPHLIAQRGIEPPQNPVRITADGLTVGSAGGRTGQRLVLNDPLVERAHLRIDWDGQQITVVDLGSRNGTFIDENRLEPETVYSWEPGQVLRVGSYQVRIEMRPVEPSNGASQAPATIPLAAAAAATGNIGLPLVDVILENADQILMLTPGEPAEVRLRILNRRIEAVALQVTVEGNAEHWVTGQPRLVTVAPNAEHVLPIRVLVPRNAEHEAGEYSVPIRVRSTQNLNEVRTVEASWLVQPFFETSISLQPPTRTIYQQEEAIYTLTVRNNGNATTNYTIEAGFDEPALSYLIDETTLFVEPGKEEYVRINARINTEPEGERQEYRFSVQVKPGRGETQSTAAGLTWQAKRSWPWPLIAAIAIPLLLLLAFGAWLGLANAQNQDQTAAQLTVIAAETRGAAGQGMAGTAFAELEGRNRETALALQALDAESARATADAALFGAPGTAQALAAQTAAAAQAAASLDERVTGAQLAQASAQAMLSEAQLVAQQAAAAASAQAENANQISESQTNVAVIGERVATQVVQTSVSQSNQTSAALTDKTVAAAASQTVAAAATQTVFAADRTATSAADRTATAVVIGVTSTAETRTAIAETRTATAVNITATSVAGATATAGAIQTATVAAGQARGLEFATVPGVIRAGEIISPALRVFITDAGGRVVPISNVPIEIQLSSNSSNGILRGTIKVIAVNGIATFSDLSIREIGKYQLAASSNQFLPGVVVRSGEFEILAAPASVLLLTGRPPDTFKAGQPFEITIVAKDRFGNTVTNYQDTALRIRLNKNQSALRGVPANLNFQNGVLTVSNLSVTQASTDYRISAEGNLSVASDPFEVTAGDVTQLVFNRLPQSIQAGSPFDVSLRAQDQFGNTNTTYQDTTLRIQLNKNQNSLQGLPQNFTFADGVLTLNNLRITQAGTNYQFEANGLIDSSSDAFNVASATATRIAFTIEPPATISAGTNFTVALTAYDQYNNIVTGYQDTSLRVQLNKNQNALQGVPAGNLTFTNGVLNLTVNVTQVDTNYRLEANGVLDHTSIPFNVTPAAASQLMVTSSPPNLTRAGQPLSIAAEVQDRFGNRINSFTGEVQLAISAGPGTRLFGTVNKNATNGQVSFGVAEGVNIQLAGAGYRLSASSIGLQSGESLPFTISPDDARRLIITTQPVDTRAGSPLVIGIEARDQFDNLATGFNGTVSLAFAPSGNPTNTTLEGQRSRPASGGRVAFGTTGDANIERVSTGYILRASSGGLVTVDTDPFNITPGPAAQITLVSPSSPTSTINAGGTITITVRVIDQFTNPIEGRSVTFTSSTTGSRRCSFGVSNSISITTNNNGEATASCQHTGSPGGTIDVTVSSPSPTPAPSNVTIRLTVQT